MLHSLSVLGHPSCFSHKHIREECRDLREEKQQDQSHNETDEKGIDTTIDDIEGFTGNLLHQKDRDSHRRDDHTDHDSNADDNAEPYRIEAQLHNDRVENGGRQYHEGKIIDEGPSDEVDKNDDDHDDVPVDAEAGGPVCDDHRDLGDSQKMAEHG